MFQIDDPTASSTLPAIPAPTGTPGWFVGGNTQTGLPGTRVRFWWLNMIQQELAGLLAAVGIAQDKSNNGQVLQAIEALIGTQTEFLSTLQVSGTPGGTVAIPAGTVIPAGARKAYVEIVAGGGAGGSGNTAAGGGGAAGAGVRGWINVIAGQAIAGQAGAGGVTTANGTGGSPAANSTLSINGAAIATLNAGGGGGLGGSTIAPGSTSFGTVAQAVGSLLQFAGESGQNGLSIAEAFISGNGGASMFGGGGKGQPTPNTTGASAPGAAPTFYGAGGSGSTGSGTVGGNGGPGLVQIWFFG